jgi:hypothetical protein
MTETTRFPPGRRRTQAQREGAEASVKEQERAEGK